MKKLFLPLAAGLVLLFAGCASPGGPKFSASPDATATPPPGQSLVFILRPPAFVDSANDWVVGLNGQDLVTVPNGGYHLFTNAPGLLKFTSRYVVNPLNFGLLNLLNKDREVLRLEAQPDVIHYLKIFCGQMEELPPAKGKEGLVKCSKIVPAMPTNTTSDVPTTQRPD